jgi:DNA-binding transcriptional LysR family regulator
MEQENPENLIFQDRPGNPAGSAAMEQRQLLNFLSVCEEKSFSKAAERRFISQQGLSKSIKLLEEQLGVPLFYRLSGGSIELTEFGSALQMTARSYINQHDYMVDSIRRLKEKTTSYLSVGLTIGFHELFLPHFFKNFILKHPSISLDITSFPDDSFQNAMLEHKIQIGFAHGVINTDVFDSIHSERAKFVLIAGKEHPFAQHPSIKLEQLRNEKVISMNHHIYPNSEIFKLCAQRGFKPGTLLHGSESSLIQELCSTNQMVAFWAGSMDRFPDLVCINIEDMDLYFEFHLIVNRYAYISDAAKQFIDYTKEQFGRWEIR